MKEKLGLEAGSMVVFIDTGSFGLDLLSSRLGLVPPLQHSSDQKLTLRLGRVLEVLDTLFQNADGGFESLDCGVEFAVEAKSHAELK